MSFGNRLVSVINLGRIGYKEAWAVQQVLARRHIPQDRTRQDIDKTRQDLGLDHDRQQIETTIEKLSSIAAKDTLLLCEHNPVYTIGIRTKDYPLDDEERLKRIGAEFYRTDRGGLITFHGPGQLVAYPILNLGNFKKSIRWYVCQLETCIIKLCKEFGIQGETSPHTGVWVRDNKIAAIGRYHA